MTDTAELEVVIGIRKFGRSWILAVNGEDKTSGPLGYVLAQGKAHLALHVMEIKPTQDSGA